MHIGGTQSCFLWLVRQRAFVLDKVAHARLGSVSSTYTAREDQLRDILDNFRLALLAQGAIPLGKAHLSLTGNQKHPLDLE